MTDRKDTNPFNTEESTPHLPASVYQPNPFPINPAEGNPWAGTSNEQPYQKPPQQGHVNAYDNTSSSYGHSYNNTSDGGSQSNYSTYTMQMPTPSVNYNINNPSPYGYSNSAYNPNAYAPAYDSNAYSTNAYNPNVNAYSSTNDNQGVDAYENESHVKNERENSYDDNTTELEGSVTAANPGIETHDPDKLNISNDMIKASLNGTPNKWRLLSRFIQFIASVGALSFIIGAPAASHVSTPDVANKTAIIFLHIVSIVSIIYSFGHLVFYCMRRWRHKNKAPRWSLLLVDIVLGVSFGTLMVFLIKDFQCPPGKLNGWCDFYNTAIFFTVLAFVTYAVSFIWDLVGGFKSFRS